MGRPILVGLGNSTRADTPSVEWFAAGDQNRFAGLALEFCPVAQALQGLLVDGVLPCIFRRVEIRPAAKYHDRIDGLNLDIGAAGIQRHGLCLQQVQRTLGKIGRGSDPEQAECYEYQRLGKPATAIEQ